MLPLIAVKKVLKWLATPMVIEITMVRGEFRNAEGRVSDDRKGELTHGLGASEMVIRLSLLRINGTGAQRGIAH